MKSNAKKIFLLLISSFVFALPVLAKKQDRFNYFSKVVEGAKVSGVYIDLSRINRVSVFVPPEGPGTSFRFSDLVRQAPKNSVIINGAFFSKTNYRVVGNLIETYRLINQAPANQPGTTLCFDQENKASIIRSLFFSVHYILNSGENWWEKANYNQIHGINTPIDPKTSPNVLKIYNYYYGNGKVPIHGGKAAIIKNGYIDQIISGEESVVIPFQGHVLVALGSSVEKIDRMNRGDKIKIVYHNENDQKWNQFVQTAVGAGPMLLRNGQVEIKAREEGFRDTSVLSATNRLAVGIINEKKIFFTFIHSAVTLEKAGKIMRELGALDAMNLDGGASTAFSFQSNIKVSPSRQLTNVLLFE